MEHADLTKQTFGDTSDRDYLLQISSGITSSIAEREREPTRNPRLRKPLT